MKFTFLIVLGALLSTPHAFANSTAFFAWNATGLPVSHNTSAPSEKNSARTLREKILAAGVPDGSLRRIMDFIEKNQGNEILQDVYTCRNQAPESVSYCDDRQRSLTTKTIRVIKPRFVVSIDFSKPSTVERMYVIDLQTGAVGKFRVAHGQKSGYGRWAHKFSNIKDSRQSALGLYQTGEIYNGSHGQMVRMYGLERSNDQAYRRDIVIHKADYAKPEFMKRIDHRTGKPYGRLGLSWGCPAISPEDFNTVLPVLKTGVIYDLYHPDLMEKAQSGHEVKTESPSDEDGDANSMVAD